MSEKPGVWLKAFCPDARCLSEDEVAALPAEQREAMQDKEGLWLDLFCPDQSCLRPEETLVEVKPGKSPRGEQGFWLTLFCPEGACRADDSSEAV